MTNAKYKNMSALTKYKVFDSLSYPVCVLSEEGFIEYCSTAFGKNFPAKRDAEGSGYMDICSGEYAKPLSEAYGKALRGSSSKCFAAIDFGDGNKIPAQIHFFPMLEEEGFSRTLMIIQRLKKRQFEQIEISENEERRFRFSPFPVLRFAGDGELVKCSASVEGFTGYSIRELLKAKDEPLKKLFVYDADRIKNIIAEISDGRRAFYRKGELKILSKDGGEKFVNITMYAVQGENEAQYADMVMEDITELRLLKEKINAINRIQLLQDITKGFLHSVSSSINSIMSRTRLLLMLTDDENIRSGISQIEDSAIYLGTQVRRIKNSIGHKGYFYDERTEPLQIILDDAVEFSQMQFRADLKENRRKISIWKNYFLPYEIKTDTGLLREIIISVILKVADCLDKNGTVDISAQVGGDVILSVSTAKGNTDKKAVRLQRLVNVFSGIDIRHAAEKLGLKVFEEESMNGYSSKIAVPERLFVNKPDRKQEPFPKPENLNILIVEPDEALRKILSDVFDGLGNRIYSHTEGKSALEEFKRNSCDILITDYDIAGITGIELAARAKEINENIKTVIMSKWPKEDMSAYKNVMDVFITKPFRLDSLIFSLSNVLKNDHAH